MSDDYVSREVFDETVKRYEVMLDRERAKYEGHAAKLEFLVKMLRAKNEREIDALRQNIDNLRDSLSRSVTILGICITAVGLFFAGVQIYLALYLPVVSKLGGGDAHEV